MFQPPNIIISNHFLPPTVYSQPHPVYLVLKVPAQTQVSLKHGMYLLFQYSLYSLCLNVKIFLGSSLQIRKHIIVSSISVIFVCIITVVILKSYSYLFASSTAEPFTNDDISSIRRCTKMTLYSVNSKPRVFRHCSMST